MQPQLEPILFLTNEYFRSLTVLLSMISFHALRTAIDINLQTMISRMEDLVV